MQSQCCSCLFVSGRTVVYRSHYIRPQFPPKIDFVGPNYRLQRLMLRLILTGPAGLCWWLDRPVRTPSICVAWQLQHCAHLSPQSILHAYTVPLTSIYTPRTPLTSIYSPRTPLTSIYTPCTPYLNLYSLHTPHFNLYSLHTSHLNLYSMLNQYSMNTLHPNLYALSTHLTQSILLAQCTPFTQIYTLWNIFSNIIILPGYPSPQSILPPHLSPQTILIEDQWRI